MIELLALEDGKEEGCDHEPRRGTVAGLPAMDGPRESDPLGPTRAALASECVLPLALALTSHRLGRLLENLSDKGFGRDFCDWE